MTVLIKQPSESRVYTLNFRNLLAAGDTIASVTSLTAEPSNGLTLGAAAIASPRVKFRAEDGIAGTNYKITAVVVTSGGDTLEGEGELEVSNL